jgi:hypothetical protein
MYSNKLYGAEIDLTSLVCACNSLLEIGEFLDGLGVYLQKMEDVGIAISDHELLKYGKIKLETDDPKAAEVFELCCDLVDDNQADDNRETH